jgi:hypothetical protein
MRSFVRQLNQYSFAKEPIDTYIMNFSHPCFLRDRKDLLHHVKRRAPGELPVSVETSHDEVHTSFSQEGCIGIKLANASRKPVQFSLETTLAEFDNCLVSSAMVEGVVMNEASTRLRSWRVKRSSENSIQVKIVADSDDRNTMNSKARSRWHTSTAIKVNGDEFQGKDGKEAGESHKMLVSDSCSIGVTANKNSGSILATAMPTLNLLTEGADAAVGLMFGTSGWLDGCTLQPASNDPPSTVHTPTLDGDCIQPLDDLSGGFLRGSKDDFSLPFSELLKGVGDEIVVYDTYLPNLEQVCWQSSDGGGADIQPHIISQPTGDAIAPPQVQEPAKMDSHT